jgi:hypothetical protein
MQAEEGKMLDRRIAAGAGLSLGAFLGMTATAGAVDYTVDRTDDPAGTGACVLATPNDCSLRQALHDAENGNRPTVDRVLFKSGLSGTIAISTQGLFVSEPVDVVGPGANVLTVSAGNGQRVFDTEQGTAGDPVTISGLTLTEGYGSGSVGGGAIYSKDTYLTVESSTISNSTAGIAGANYVGGGIRQVGDQLLILNSTISGNHGANGGGVDAFEADVGIENSTISGNSATGTGSGSGYGYGGGIWLDVGAAGGSLISYGSTISGNHAYDGGGITANATNNGLASTVVANNTATAATPHRDLRNAGPAAFNLAFSLVESPAGASIVPISGFAGTNILGVDPQLGALAANGGPTRTLRPSLTSPLLDKGSTTIGPTDQRGLPRPFDIPSVPNAGLGDASDIGAVELQASDFATTPAPLPGGAPQTQAPPTQTRARKCKKKKKKSKKRSVHIAKKCKKKRR